MAQGVTASFDMQGLDDAIRAAEKALSHLANHSEQAAKRINTAINSIGDAGINLQNVNDATRRLSELRNTLKAIQEQTYAESDETIVRQLERDAESCIDEINGLVSALGKINAASIGEGFEDLSLNRLRSLLAAQQTKLAAGGEDVVSVTTKKRGWYTETKEETKFVEYTNEEIQEIVNNIAMLESMIRQRLTPTIGKLGQAQKQALNEKKAEMQADKEAYETWLQQAYSKAKVESEAQEAEFQRMRAAIKERMATPQGALDLASQAKSQEEMEEALKIIESARKKINLSTKEGVELNEQLIQKYSKLKTAIEEAEGKTKDMNTLVATEASKYARLLEEMNKYEKSLKQVKESEAFQKGDSKALQDAEALEQYIVVLNERKKAYDLHAESIIEAERKVNAKIAQENIMAREQEEAKKAEIARKYAGMSPKEAERAISESGIAAIEKEKKDIEELIESKYKLNSTNENYVQEIQKVDEQIARHKSNLDKLNTAYKEQLKQKKKIAQTPQGAIESAREAKSVQDLVNAYKNLDAARKGVDVSTKDGKKAYKDLGKEMERVQRKLEKYGTAVSDVNTKHRELLHTDEQLKRALTGLFSVSAIKGYINKLIEVRGEFELQQRSLQALLQNKDEADKLWDKTIQLAIRSPYRIKDLVTYTKQLAAYRVESDKLYDTTKMLADISAGLGVDMQRLILAYGQVKAANYLRGTELRQFSEAGINVLGELSKYFTELEGRVVSVGDVFERVSKRMVSFADVEEVLQRATGEGGIFYNMQEIQAETLGAQMKNLGDSIQVMMNEIGEEMEGSLKGALKSIRAVIDNWRDFVPLVKTLVAVLVSYKTIQAVVALGNTRLGRTFKILTTDAGKASLMMSNLGKNLLSFGGSLLRGGIIGGIIVLVGWLAKLAIESNKAERAAKQLRKDLDKLYEEDTTNLDKQISKFEDLVRRLGETAEGTKEYKDIISQINSQYGEYLGFLADENTAYEKIAGSVDKVVYSLTQKARANTLERAFQKTQTTYLDSIDDYKKQISEILSSGRFYTTDEQGNKLSFLPNKKEIENIFRLIEKKVLETGQTIHGWSGFKELLSEFVGSEVDWDAGGLFAKKYSGTVFSALSQDILGLNEALKQLDEDINNVYTAGVYGTAEYLNTMKEFEAGIPELRDKLATNMFPAYDKEGNKIKNYFKNLAEPQQEAIQKEIERRKLTIEFTYELTPEEGSVTAAVNKAMDEWDKHSFVIKKFNKGITKILSGKDALVINAVYQEQETANTKSIRQLVDEFVSGYKEQEKEIEHINGLKNGTLEYTKEEYAELQKQLKTAEDLKTAYYEALKLLGALDSLDPEKSESNKLRKRAQLLEEMRKEYEKQRKYLSPEDAASEVRLAYEEAWVAVGGSINDITRTMLSDSTALANYIKNTLLPLADLLPKEQRESARQVLTNIMGGFTTHASDEAFNEANNELKRQVENLFDNYELSVDLKQLNIPASFAEELFGLETMNLKSLREQLEKMSGLFVGTIMEEYYNQAKERLANMEDKDRKERLKKYLAYTRDAIGERAKIKLEELRKLQEIEETFEEGEAKKRAVKGVKKEAQDALNKYEWEQFKSSDVFANIFNDLEQASATSIQYAIDQIKKYKAEWADMPVTEAKEMIKRLNDLEVALVSKGRPAAVIDTLEKELELKMKSFNIDVKSRTAYAQLRQSLIDNNTIREEQNVVFEKQIAEFETMQQLLDEGKLSWDNLTKAQRELLSEQGWDVRTFKFLDTTNLQEYIENTRESIKTNQEFIGGNAAALAMINALSKAYEAQNQKIQQWIGYVSQAYSSVRELVGVLGDVKETSDAWWDLGEQMVNLTSQAVEYYWQLRSQKLLMKELEEQAKLTAAAQNMANLTNVIGWVLLALQAIVAVIKAIANHKQAKINAQIESHYDEVEKLRKAYERLEKSIDEAYNIQDLQRYNRDLQDNLEKQKKAVAKAKAAAESGKNTKENIQAAEEAQAKYDELLEESAEKAKEFFSEMTAGIFDDSISAAEGFIDAWLDAYQEVGDGMSGLTSHMEEQMLEMVKRQAAYAIAGEFVNTWKEDLSNIMGDDMEMADSDWNNWLKMVKEDIPKLNELLTEYYKNVPLTNNDGLSGLQKGIQGITADQADVLAAYWNSVRFLAASIDQKFDIPLSSFMSNDTAVNPMLNELKGIARQAENIYKLLDGMTAVHEKGGRGIKVVM